MASSLALGARLVLAPGASAGYASRQEDGGKKRNARELSEQLLHKGFDTLGAPEQRVLRRIADRLHITRNVRAEQEAGFSFGQRLADRVAAFGGSWPFIICFGAVLLIWIVLNSYLLLRLDRVFDPFPYILLNLVLSMLAAVQAPVILMSQNRQSAKDRLDAAHDYEVNLKAELEIMALHQKLDALTTLVAALRDGTARDEP